MTLLSFVIRLVADFAGLALALYGLVLALVRCLTKHEMENYMVRELYLEKKAKKSVKTTDIKNGAIGMRGA